MILPKSRRAEDNVNLFAIVDAHLERIKASGKKTIAHSAEQRCLRLTDAKRKLELKLESLKAKSGGLFGWMRNISAVKKIKKQISVINEMIVAWINSIYKYMGF